MDAKPELVLDFGNFINNLTKSTQTRVDVKRNEPVEVVYEDIHEYPSSGKQYKSGRYHLSAFDTKFEDVEGFSILKTQSSLYKQIWSKYGHIASSQVPDGHIASSQVSTDSYIVQVAMVVGIMKTIIEMNQYRFIELSLEIINRWEEKIKMVEVLKFNVKWLRERFEEVKRVFHSGEKLKTMLVEEKLMTISDGKSKLVEAEEGFIIAEDKLKLAQEELKMVQQKVSALKTSIIIVAGD